VKYSELMVKQVHPLILRSSIIEAELKGVKIGEICEIRGSVYSPKVIARAQVIGFNQHTTVLSLLGNANGLSRECVLHPTGKELVIPVGDFLCGCVIDPAGNITERFTETPETQLSHLCSIQANAPGWQHRRGIYLPLLTGVKALDGLMTCGVGQRVGIFSSAGCGKTTLMHMLIEHIETDIFVIGLIGERGREVTEFMDILRKSGRRKDCVMVCATSDNSSMDRCNAVLVATTIAEYFRDSGKNVVLFIDSITRYARALRDLALSAGESPARRGYPASVFDNLPKILERAGNVEGGSITAFYTILLESDDEGDPIANEIRSILDGHIYLSRELAAQNHYPAIDILNSLSRVATQVCKSDHLNDAAAVRRKLAKIEELKMFIDMGEYKFGENQENDRVVKQRDALNQWLCQSCDEIVDHKEMLSEMSKLAS
jgi:FliI/YscN family ATPase